jgi:TPP-dependent pyruvate/acetoin dehydrogenase alpha subunit
MQRRYRELYRIRRVEQEIARVYPTDKVKSPVHLSIGQEAVAVGVCEALKPDDVVFGTYRSHALYLAKGGDLKGMIAELYGKRTGCASGKGGSMHLVATNVLMMGTSAVVGTTIPNAAGYAYALKLRKEPRVVVSFFGDGAVEEGVFWETINFASLKKLPILFVCENNNFAIHSKQLDRQPASNVWERVAAFKIPSERTGDDIDSICAKSKSAVDKIRAGGGPIFLEVPTYRWLEHVGPNEDFQLGYRTKAECDAWIARDAVKTTGAKLDEKTRTTIEAEVEKEINEAFDFAEKSAWPAPEELYTCLFKEGN